MVNFGEFVKTWSGQTVLPDRSLLKGQKLMKNAKLKQFKCDILSNFQTMCMRRFYDNGFTEKCPFLMNAKSRICHDFFRIFFHLLTLEVKVSCIQNTLFGWISFSTSNCLVYDSFCWILLQIEVGRRAKNECFCFFSVNISLPMLCIWNLF